MLLLIPFLARIRIHLVIVTTKVVTCGRVGSVDVVDEGIRNCVCDVCLATEDIGDVLVADMALRELAFVEDSLESRQSFVGKVLVRFVGGIRIRCPVTMPA